MPFFQHGDASIFYEIKGDINSTKSPVLLLHGNGENHSIFNKAIAPLLDKYKFISIDSRGQGRSTGTGITYEAMTQDVLSLLEQLNIFSCDVIGFSDGGIIALMMAMNTNIVRRMIAIGANLNPKGIKPFYRMCIGLMRFIYTTGGKQKQRELYDLMLTAPNIDGKDLRAVNCEVLVCAGTKDMIKHKHTQYIAASLPNAKLRFAEGAGHMIPHTHPKWLCAVIKSFLG